MFIIPGTIQPCLNKLSRDITTVKKIKKREAYQLLSIY